MEIKKYIKNKKYLGRYTKPEYNDGNRYEKIILMRNKETEAIKNK